MIKFFFSIELYDDSILKKFVKMLSQNKSFLTRNKNHKLRKQFRSSENRKNLFLKFFNIYVFYFYFNLNNALLISMNFTCNLINNQLKITNKQTNKNSTKKIAKSINNNKLKFKKKRKHKQK